MARKNALGKGLSGLMAIADAEVSAVSPEQPKDTELDINEIVINKDQPRKHFDEDSLNELAASIEKNGILQPILVRPKEKKYEIIAGERRYQAAMRAGLEKVPVIIREVSDSEVFILALIENLQRSDLNPIEEAQGYKKLISENNFTQEELSKVVSKSRSTISNAMRLLDLPYEVQELMGDGRLSAGHAKAILMVATEEGRIKLAEKVISENLSVRQTENLAPLFSGNNSDKTPKVPTPQSFKRAARQLRSALQMPVKVKTVRNKNKIEIEFKDEEELAKMVKLLCAQDEVGE